MLIESRFWPSKRTLGVLLVGLWVQIVLILSTVDYWVTVPKLSNSSHLHSYRCAHGVPTVLFLLDSLNYPNLSAVYDDSALNETVKLKVGMMGKGRHSQVLTDATFEGTYLGGDESVLCGPFRILYIGDEHMLKKLTTNSPCNDHNGWNKKIINDTICNFGGVSLFDPKCTKGYKNAFVDLLMNEFEDHQSLNLRILIIVAMHGVKPATYHPKKNAIINGALQLVNVLSSEMDFFRPDAALLATSFEEQAPLLIWGEQIAPQMAYPETRIKVERRDLAPLLSCFLGYAPPLTSMGIVPYGILNSHIQGQCLLSNLRQMSNFLSRVAVKKNYFSGRLGTVARGSPVDLKPFMRSVEERLFTNELPKFTEIHELTEECRKAIHYFLAVNYELTYHLTLAILVGWILSCVTLMIPMFQRKDQSSDNNGPLSIAQNIAPKNQFSLNLIILDAAFILLEIIVFVIVMMENQGPRIYLYALTVPLVWWIGIRHYKNWLSIRFIKPAQGGASDKIIALALFVLIYVRWMFIREGEFIPSLIQLEISIVIIILSMINKWSSTMISHWFASAIPFLVLHTFLEKDNFSGGNVYKEAAGGAFWLGVCVVGVCCIATKVIEVAPVMAANILACIVLLSKPTGTQIIWPYHLGWMVVFLVPILGSSSVPVRLFQIFTSLAVPYCLIGTRLEPIILFFVLVHVSSWMLLEAYKSKTDLAIAKVKSDIEPNRRELDTNDIRRIYFYVYYCEMGLELSGLFSDVLAWPVQLHEVPAKIIFKNGLFYGMKGLVPILAITVLVNHLMRKTKGHNLGIHLGSHIILGLWNLMAVFHLAVTPLSHPNAHRLAVSLFCIPPIIGFLMVLSYAFAYGLTLPSIVEVSPTKVPEEVEENYEMSKTPSHPSLASKFVAALH